MLTDLMSRLLADTSFANAVGWKLPLPRPPASRTRFHTADRLLLDEPLGTLRALQALTTDSRAHVAHAGAPMGLLSVDPSTCTACGACALACPTSTLKSCPGGAGGWTLSYDPHRCVGCGLCVRTCPEDAISVERGIDVSVLDHDTDVLLCARQPTTCPTCGRSSPDMDIRRTVAMRLATVAPTAAALAATSCGHCGPGVGGTDVRR